MTANVARRVARAFTLLELLVVMGIVSLLVALLLPALGRAKQAAIDAKCLAGERQIATASVAFAVDHRGRFVSAKLNAPDMAVQTCLWIADYDRFATYGMNDAAWQCPSRNFTPFREPGFLDQVSHGYQYFGGIPMWRSLAGVVPGRSPIGLDDATSGRALVADATLRIDSVWGGGSALRFGGIPAHGAQDADGTPGTPRGGNHLFADGSGKWVPFADMLPLHSWNPVTREAYWWQRDVP